MLHHTLEPPDGKRERRVGKRLRGGLGGGPRSGAVEGCEGAWAGYAGVARGELEPMQESTRICGKGGRAGHRKPHTRGCMGSQEIAGYGGYAVRCAVLPHTDREASISCPAAPKGHRREYPDLLRGAHLRARSPPPSRYRLSDAKSPDTFLRRCLEGLRMYSAGCGVKKCPTKNWLSDLTSKGIRLHRRRSKTLFRPIKHTVAPKPRINRCNPFLPSLPQLVGLEVCRSVGI